MISLLLLLATVNLTVARITGLTEPVAEVALGPPDVARKEARGAMWTYRKVDCVLFVYLADKGEGMKVTSLSAGPRRAGEQAPTTEACLQSEKAVEPLAAAPPAPPVPAPAPAPEAAPAPAPEAAPPPAATGTDP